MPPSTEAHAAVDSALADLRAGENTWAALPLRGRRALLERVRDLTVAHGADWVDAARTIKGLDASSPLVGEEWMSGPYAFASGAATLAHTLDALDSGRSPLESATFGSAPGDRTTIQVLPLGIFDSLLLNGFHAEVWLNPGVDAEKAKRTAGLAQLDPAATNGIGVVLGAGNITSIAPLDTLYELIAHNRVVALKLNPITDPLLPVLTTVLGPLIEVGAVRILTGGPDTGTYLVHHAHVDHVHMTGSSTTHDAIVFGPGETGAERKAANDPILTKPMTSELGGVSPTIVLPGQWSRADIAFQAEHIATQRLHNSGYNCVASQVVVLSSGWKQRDEFIAALRAALDRAPTRRAYYPGSDARVSGALENYPQSARLRGGRVLIGDLDPGSETALLTTEYFAPVLGVIELPYDGEQFAIKAVEAANSRFVGTLGVNIIAHPKTLHALGDRFESLLAELRYGTIAVNSWTGLGFLSAAATWGAFPGHTIDDVQSGIGIVHNALLIDGAERTVVRGPFRPSPRSLINREWTISPKPPWFVTNRTAATTGRLLTGFAGAPSWAKLPAIFASALRG
ncbi:aldehyde dehydrogenase family protein [Rhodococcoides yunnanense]|uniref:aldehyde dehydrogenase family protein n=1 Tax=Rhodococcoides yunnanense TaxID=278209 RepID=UPI0009328B75